MVRKELELLPFVTPLKRALHAPDRVSRQRLRRARPLFFAQEGRRGRRRRRLRTTRGRAERRRTPTEAAESAAAAAMGDGKVNRHPECALWEPCRAVASRALRKGSAGRTDTTDGGLNLRPR